MIGDVLSFQFFSFTEKLVRGVTLNQIILTHSSNRHMASEDQLTLREIISFQDTMEHMIASALVETAGCSRCLVCLQIQVLRRSQRQTSVDTIFNMLAKLYNEKCIRTVVD